jgi:hypothetical protein
MYYGDLYNNTDRNTFVVRYETGRNAFYKWIKDSLAANKPYNQMATELISSRGENTFTQGELNWLVGAWVMGNPQQDNTGALPKTDLKRELTSHLHHARRRRAEDPPKRRRVDRGVGKRECMLIERIESLESDLELLLFGEQEILVKREIHVVVRIAAQNVAARVAAAVNRRSGRSSEAGSVEPAVRRGIGEFCRAAGHHVCAASCTRVGRIAVEGRSERETILPGHDSPQGPSTEEQPLGACGFAAATAVRKPDPA